MTVKQKGGHPVCLGCGCKLTRLKWNGKCDVLVCNNWHCPNYHQPAVIEYPPKGSLARTIRLSPVIEI